MTRRGFLDVGPSALAWLIIVSSGHARADTTRETFVELEQKTREYEDSLARLVTIEEEAVTRATAGVERYRALHAEGLVSGGDLDGAEHAAAKAQDDLDETRGQLADAQRILVEAQGLNHLATLAPALAPGGERSTPEVVEYRGVSPWALGQVSSLEEFFVARFGRSLPVSALGQTLTHDRLGLDHRNAVDVAVHPDTVEGRALLAHLRGLRVPFLAFRRRLARVSTGPHVHVGTPSLRLG